MLIGDFNAKVGGNQFDTWPEVVGRYGLGLGNDRGSHLLQFCAINKLIIGNTLFRHNETRRFTWMSPDGKSKNQIDYIIIQEKLKSSLKNCRSYQSADIGSDHSLVVANFMLKQKRRRTIKSIPRRYDVEKLITNHNLASEFKVQLGGTFEPLLNIECDDIEDLYSAFKEATNKTTEMVVGYKRRKQVEGLQQNIEIACSDRRRARLDKINNPDQADKRDAYKVLNTAVKSAVKKHKNTLLEKRLNF